MPDNLNTGADTSDLDDPDDPEVTKTRAELAAHYGGLAGPACALRRRPPSPPGSWGIT
ncbi:hypothetical protein ABZX93_12445 [Streptomyces sp. NPDC006632]|uniref:hypothetical protein n=1 Tax=Streptomyces sp. NPDC006632 TaxID=3157182 RepID=UPI0033BD2424